MEEKLGPSLYATAHGEYSIPVEGILSEEVPACQLDSSSQIPATSKPYFNTPLRYIPRLVIRGDNFSRGTTAGCMDQFATCSTERTYFI